MNNEHFDDAVLSAIIDGEAEPDLVASVKSSSDASQRLEQMRQAVQIVAEEPPPASPERRSASIAAAMAAATSAPEVTSLAAARHEKAEEKKRRSLSTGWIAAVAAAVAFIVAIPIAISLAPDGGTDTATTDSAAEIVDAAGDAADAVEGDEEEAMEDEEEAMEDEAEPEVAMEDEEEAMEDEAMEDEEEAMEEEEVVDLGGDAEDITTEGIDRTAGEEEAESAVVPAVEKVDVENFELSELPAVSNAIELSDLIAIGAVGPLYSPDEVVTAGVNPACVAPSEFVTEPVPYALATLTPFGGADRLLLVEFADNGTSRTLDAEDCALLG